MGMMLHIGGEKLTCCVCGKEFHSLVKTPGDHGKDYCSDKCWFLNTRLQQPEDTK